MPGGDDADRTRSFVGDAFPNGGGRRILVAWESGSRMLKLPQEGALTIGRAPESGLVIDHVSVSRHHAVLRTSSAGVTIEDLGSSNGTRVRGERIKAGTRVELIPGDLAEVGGAQIALHGASARNTASEPRAVPSGGMDEIFSSIDVIAPSELSVLLLGETGVGKDVVATRIHERSRRRDKPMLRINFAALPDALLESELFGHERGAFTGATQSKAGLLETAAGGSVLLDEIGDTPMSTQSKILRALENHEIFRVGGVGPRPIDVRFIAATSRELDVLVAEGRFRADLLYRLSGAVLRVPSLRERREEIIPLAESFLTEASRRSARSSTPRFSREARSALESHTWPGNVRELKNTIERALLFCPGDVLSLEHLAFHAQRTSFVPAQPSMLDSLPAPAFPTAPPSRPASPNLPSELGEIERQRILEALEQCGGNQSRAARMLGISRRTLLHRLDAYGVPRPRKGSE